MLTVVTVVKSAFFLLACSLQWQLYHASSRQENPAYGGAQVTTKLPYRGDVQQHRKVHSVTPEEDYADRTPSPDFVRHYRNRIRNRESRIVHIQIVVSDAVNNGRGNFSVVKSPISERQLDSIKRRFKEDAKLPQNDDSRISRTILLPACGASADDGGNRSLSGRTTKDFRIFFNVVPPRRILHPETIQIKSAHLFLRVKPADNAVVVSADGKKPKMTKIGEKNASSKIPNDVLKVQIHSFDAAKLKEKSSPIVDEKKEEGKKRRRGRGVAGKKRPLKSVSFDRRNSSDWLKIGLLRTAERWYQLAIKQPGLRITVLNSVNQRVDPLQIFYDFDCELQKFPVQQRSTVGEDDEDAGKGGRAEPGSDGENHPRSSSSSSSSSSSRSDDAFTFPYLEIVAKASPKKLEVRKQRHLVTQKRNTCHMRHVQVNTEDKRLFNMTNIIAPLHFKSAVCEGFCPRCNQPTRPRSDAIQTSAASSCSCRPVKTKSLPVVYDDEEGRVFVRSIPDAVVTKCGCRP